MKQQQKKPTQNKEPVLTLGGLFCYITIEQATKGKLKMENKEIAKILQSVTGVKSVKIEYPPRTLSEMPVSFILKMSSGAVYRFNEYLFGMCPVYAMTTGKKEKFKWTNSGSEEFQNQKNEKLAAIKIQSLYQEKQIPEGFPFGHLGFYPLDQKQKDGRANRPAQKRSQKRNIRQSFKRCYRSLSFALLSCPEISQNTQGIRISNRSG
mgnify:CR=1 FL=1